MADGQILAQLESAAQVLLSPPNVVTSEQRHSAEAVFINFRKTRSPFQLCRNILETSKIDYVLFEVAGLIKEAGVREWSYMTLLDIIDLRNYLLRYVLGRSNLAPFVREKILQVIAVMTKRASIEDHGADRNHVLKEIQRIIYSGDLPQQLVGCGIISALMQEYEASVKSSDVGLTNLVHLMVKEEFEKSDLKETFVFVMRLLEVAMKGEIPQQLLKHLVTILANVLCWSFVTGTEVEVTATKPPTSWADVLVLSNPINFFFEVYFKVRTDPQIAHHAMTCLTQLLFEGFIWTDVKKDDYIAYYTTYLRALFRLLDCVKILDREALGISMIFRRLVSPLDSLPSELIDDYLEHLTKYTCLFGEGAAEEETVSVENTYYMEAFNGLLTTWLLLPDVVPPSGSDPHPGSFGSSKPTGKNFKNWRKNFCTAAVRIIETFLQCHLTPPIGVRGLGREIEAEEIEEIEQDDRDKFSDQLRTLGYLARHVPSHVLPLLARLLEDCTSRICTQLQQINQNDRQFSDYRTMENLSEDVHWLILVAGRTLTLEYGEQVPPEIAEYSLKQFDTVVQDVDLDVTLKVLTSPEQHVHNIPGAEESTDHVIRLVAAVFRLCEVERRAFESKLENFMSPQVGCTIMWFLRQFCSTYLLLPAFPVMSVPLATAFGEGTECCTWVISFILSKIESNFKYATTEPNLLKDTVDALFAVVDSENKAACALKTPAFLGILNLQEVSLSENFPREARRGYYSAIVSAALAFRVSNSCREMYLRKCIDPAVSRFKAIIEQEDFVRNFHDEQCRVAIVNCFDALIGTIRGQARDPGRGVGFLSDYLSTVISELPSLIGLYHNYQEVVELILELLDTYADSYILRMNNESLRALFTTSLQTIQTFANYNKNRLNLEAASEDDTFNDIHLILQLLHALLTKDFNEARAELNDAIGDSSDAVRSGICILMPLLNVDIWKNKQLALGFLETARLLAEVNKTRIIFSGDLLKQLLSVVEIGLRSFLIEVQSQCLAFLDPLLYTLAANSCIQHPYYDALRPFFNIIFDMAVLQSVPSDLQADLSNTFYQIILLYPEEYKEAVRSVVNSQANLPVAERLSSAFSKLTKDLFSTDAFERPCLPNRKKRNDFVDKFKTFLAVTHGLFIK